ISGAGLVRLGVAGSLSLTSSATASAARIYAAAVDPRKARWEFCRLIQPQRAAQLTVAGAVRERRPAITPMAMARTSAVERLIAPLILSRETFQRPRRRENSF